MRNKAEHRTRGRDIASASVSTAFAHRDIPLHSRLIVSSVPFRRMALAEELQVCVDNAIPGLGLWDVMLEEAGFDAALDMVERSKVPAAYILTANLFTLDRPDLWSAERSNLVRLLIASARLGAAGVYGTTGPAGALSWKEAARAFTTAAGPVVREASKLGVRLMIENTSTLTHGTGFANSMRDIADVAEWTGVGLIVDIYNCWRERDFADAFRRCLPHVQVVQVSDYVSTGIYLDRPVPGDGIIPYPQLIRTMLEAGYQGPFDLEVMGPHVEAEGVIAAVHRGCQQLSLMLADAGA